MRLGGRRAGIVAGAVLGITWLAPGRSVAAADGRPRVGVLILAHGGHGSDRWDGIVRKAVKRVRLEEPLEVAFGMGMQPGEVRRFQEAADRLERKGVRQIVIVPLLVSTSSEVYRQYEYLFGLRDRAEWPEAGHPLRLEVPVTMGKALDDHPLVAEVLLERAKALSSRPAEETVILLAHGPTTDEDNAQWLAAMQHLAAGLQTGGGFARVLPLTFRDDAPKPVRDQAMRELRTIVQEAAATSKVLVVPVLIASGGVEHKIPQLLTGLSYEYSGQTLLPHPNIVRWMQEQATALIEQSTDAGSLPPTQPFSAQPVTRPVARGRGL